MTLSSTGIVSIEFETKSKIFILKYRTLAKRENVRLSEACVLTNQKNTKVSHCLVGQLDTKLSLQLLNGVF